jgi:hypothetical protein
MDPQSCARALPLFVESFTEFMDGLMEDFPDCEDLKSARHKLQIALLDVDTPSIRHSLSESMLAAFHRHVSPFYARIYQDDHKIVDEMQHKLFTELKLREKFHSTDDAEFKAIVFAHLKTLCNFANMYTMHTQVPTGMMAQITDIGREMATNMQQTGQMDMSMLLQRTTAIVQNARPEDQMQMGRAMDEGGMAQNLLGMLGHLRAQNPGAMPGMQHAAAQTTAMATQSMASGSGAPQLQ